MSEGSATWANRVRGLVLGLALGDSVGRGAVPASGPIRAGVSTQLAAFTIDGIIRAWIRGEHKGSVHWPATHSRGCHALTRSLPLAALSQKITADQLADLARDVAALTHGDPRAYQTSAAAVTLLGQCLAADAFDEAVMSKPHLLRLPDMAEFYGQIREAFDQAQQTPREKARLAQLAPDATALSALLGGVYVVASYRPVRESPLTAGKAMEALTCAAAAPDGDSVAAVTGALLGALHGVEIWPVELISRLELVWVMDTLARDLALQITESPAGNGYGPPKDPLWWERYPGW
ncbi:ADP-ribosylglycohydrolase family protein [Planomonospora corallina]|uniref:ADP-ribosylglycohydrolase family protein n=1 Tax=Planomonospora corallina TaxID=1806052 RepID=A0ABV8I6M0_9ACTN